MGLFSASGVTRVINLTTNMTSLTVYLINGKVLISLGLTAGVFSICGNCLGARFCKEGGSRAVKLLIMVVLVIMLVLAVNRFTMVGAKEGLTLYLKPDFGKMQEIGIKSNSPLVSLNRLPCGF